jgi:hypothetical protein
MNKIAIENGLAYVVEYNSEDDVQIIGPVDIDTNEPADCRVVLDKESHKVKLLIDNNEPLVFSADEKEDVSLIFKDIVETMIQEFCSKTKFVYIKDGEKYTMIGDQ